MDFKRKWQDILLYSILLLIGAVILSLPTFPSMDGPAHLYNAHIVKDLLVLGDSSPYAAYYSINSIPVPNWFDHLGLGLLLFFFQPILAQKVFLVFSVFTFVLVYNKVGKANKNSFLSLAIFPMVFSFFFFTGLYNQHWSYIVLISYLLYLSRSNFLIKEGSKSYLILLAFSVFFWITSILGFAIFLLITGCLAVFTMEDNRLRLFVNWKHIGMLTLLVLPTVILTFVFVLSTPMSNAEPHFPLWNRLIGLFHLDYIKLYNMGGETYFLGGIGFIFTVLLVILGKQLIASKNYILIIILTLLFLFAVLVPNQAGAGMLSTRLAMYFWTVVLVMVKHFVKLNKLLFLATGIVFVCFFFINNKKYNTHLKRLGKLGYEVHQMGSYIGASETVLGLNETNDYYIGHLLDYACLPNKSINVSNYEANYSWFPVQWNELNPQSKKFDKLWKMGEKDEILNLDLDWIIVYKDLNADTENIVNKNFVLHATTGQIRLFKNRRRAIKY